VDFLCGSMLPFYDKGTCPYCNMTMYENPDPDIKYSDYSSVSKHDNHNDITKVCYQCIKYMRMRGEIVDKKISEWHWIHEFVYK
jgi:hypothetical protein